MNSTIVILVFVGTIAFGCAIAIVIAGPYAVEMGIRRALPDHALRPQGHREVLAPTEPVNCLECGEEIPAGAEKCPRCGWTYVLHGAK